MKIKHSIPPKLPIKLDYSVFAEDLAEAEYSLGLLEGSQKQLHNPALLISPLSAKEAAVSSKIEGTQSSASDVFIFEASGRSERSDTVEVSNYRKAMIHAISELKNDRELSLGFINSLHQILLDGVRHKGEIGKFRSCSVWIAEKSGDPIEKAQYIPPDPLRIVEYMENIMQYFVESKERLLVKTGLIHYQFEAVHPYEDGNGRIGRLLMPILLYYRGKLTLPNIYLSGYFEKNRDLYIDSLHSVDFSQTYNDWIAFFLKAVSSQSKETQVLIDRIYKLHSNLRQRFKRQKSPYIIPFIESIFRSPVFSIDMVMNDIKATRLTCVNLIQGLISEGFVDELPFRSGRHKLYAFKDLLLIIQ